MQKPEKAQLQSQNYLEKMYQKSHFYYFIVSFYSIRSRKRTIDTSIIRFPPQARPGPPPAFHAEDRTGSDPDPILFAVYLAFYPSFYPLQASLPDYRTGFLISTLHTNASTAAPIIARNVLKNEPLRSYSIPAIVLPKEETSRFMLMIEKFTG